MSQQPIFLKNLILTDLILFLSVPSGVIYEELFHRVLEERCFIQTVDLQKIRNI